jgi:hypothetical protein
MVSKGLLFPKYFLYNILCNHFTSLWPTVGYFYNVDLVEQFILTDMLSMNEATAFLFQAIFETTYGLTCITRLELFYIFSYVCPLFSYFQGLLSLIG